MKAFPLLSAGSCASRAPAAAETMVVQDVAAVIAFVHARHNLAAGPATG